MYQESSWDVVKKLNLEFPIWNCFSSETLMYGCSDPMPNPGEYFLTKFTAEILGLKWIFFTYRSGKNLYSCESTKLEDLENVFDLEKIIDDDITMEEMAKRISSLRNENPIIAHLPGKKLRVKDILDDNNLKELSVNELHSEGGWLGGSAIHFLLRKYAEEHNEVIYLCPFCSKGRVYELYKGLRPLFVIAPFVRIVPCEAPKGWEPMGWLEFKNLQLSCQGRIIRIIRMAVKDFFLKKYPICRVEIPYGWWR